MANVSSSNGIEKYPKLRFESFLEEWKEISFCDLFTYVSNNTLSRADLNYEIGRYQNIHYGDILIKFGPFVDANTNTLPFINLAAEKNFDNMLLQDGDIIIADTAEDETVGKATEIINIGSQKIVSGLHTIACRPKIKMIPTYLGFYLNSEVYHKQLYALMQGIKVLSISKSNIETTIIKYPCMAEQEKVCSLLCLIEKRINKQKQLIEHIKKYKRGLLQAVFNQKIRLTKSEENWQVYRIGDLLKICHGKDYKDIASQQRTYPVLGTGGVIDYVDEYICNWPCVLIGRKGTINKPQYMETPFWSVDTLFYSKPNKNHHPKFQYYLFQTINWHKYNEASGVPSLSSSTIEGIKVNIPNYDTQVEIGNMFSFIDSKIEITEKNLNNLLLFKKALLQQLFI